jgi:hypothetical protein
MVEFLLTSAVIFVVMVGWQYVEYLYRRFAKHNPALGPFRAEPGCGEGCACGSGSCSAPQQESKPSKTTVSLSIRRADRAIGLE